MPIFDPAHIDGVTPQHIAQYRDRRGVKAPVRANREIALLSHIWNMAREWGYTAKENPVTRFSSARDKASAEAKTPELAARIRAFQFRDIRPKTASELPLEHASKLLGHTEHEITEKVYRRVGEVVNPTR